MFFDIKYNNLIAAPKNASGLNYRQGPSLSFSVLSFAPQKTSKGRTTGYYIKDGNYNWFQVVLNGSERVAYVRNDVTQLIKPLTQSINLNQAQEIVNKLIDSDNKIFESILRSNAIIDNLKKKGINKTTEANKLKEVAARLSQRQERIKNSKLVKYTTGIKKAYQNLFKSAGPMFTQAAQMPVMYPGAGMYKISGVSTLTAIIIGAVAGAGLIISCYYALKPDYDESTVDLKISSDLEKLLSNTDPETAKKIKENLEKQIDDSYNQGKTDGTFSGIGKIIKPLIWLGVGYAGFKYLTRKASASK